MHNIHKFILIFEGKTFEKSLFQEDHNPGEKRTLPATIHTRSHHIHKIPPLNAAKITP
jgi:hypothetical protein